MWLGSLRLDVQTKEPPGADNLVVAYLLRDGVPLTAVDLAVKAEADGRAYVASMLGQVSDAAREGFPRGVADLPPYGLEYAAGLPGHLTARLVVYGDDAWVARGIGVSVRELRRRDGRWVEDGEWSPAGYWDAAAALYTARGAGARTWTFGL